MWYDSAALSNGHPSVGIALELGGDDVYLGKAAYAGVAGAGILLDRAGHDTYGTLGEEENVAAASPGFAYLGDRAGDDTYKVLQRGLAYAIKPVGVAVSADWEGDDAYVANLDNKGGHTQAAARDFGALAILRDYGGDDAYRSDGMAQARAHDGGIALLIDDSGDDEHFETFQDLTVYGMRSLEEGGLDSPGNRGLAYYLDGGGTDSFLTDKKAGNAPEVGNEVYRVRTNPIHAWSVFVDCTTPPEASVPCEQHQANVTQDIMGSLPVVPYDAVPYLSPEP
jgi:hypothetical protein